MYQYHYDYVLKTFDDIKLLFTDTDSLVDEIKNVMFMNSVLKIKNCLILVDVIKIVFILMIVIKKNR